MADKAKFTDIYLTNYWRNGESRSGVGSTLDYTENLRKELPNLFEKFDIKKILDAPCGDFNWMRLVIELNNNLEYIGGDIVRELIEDNNRKYKERRINFLELDITEDKLPEADLMICRDCLFHLPIKEVQKFIKNFRESNIKYLLTTSHINSVKNETNSDIEDGQFCFIDLFKEPYNFPRETLYSIDDWVEGFPERKMYLWSKEQIPCII
jgi:SAM-dependent methyltransferase